MWDNNAPLQLLKTMPSKLNQENLEKIQLLIDADKYKNSIISGFDLCGIFAPFCRGCDRTSIYPCAVSYIRMLQSEGMNIEIDASPSFNCMPQPYKPSLEVPQTKPRANAASYEQRSARKPVEKRYSERPNKPRVPKEVKTEIAVTEEELPVQPVYIEEKPVEILAEKPVEITVEAKPENPVVKQTHVSTQPEVVTPKYSEVVPPAKKQEKVEISEEKQEKPLEEKKLRIAVARRKLNF